MKPFIKWAGGKKNELTIIKNSMPNNIDNYIEPFLGGGAVYFSLSDFNISGKCFVNDFSKDLISIYEYVAKANKMFIAELENINTNLLFLSKFCESNSDSFVKYYHVSDSEKAKNMYYNKLKEINLVGDIQDVSDYFLEEAIRFTDLKICSLYKKSKQGNTITRENLNSIFETILKSAFYNCIRKKYNDAKLKKNNLAEPIKLAYFYYLREYCYSSMFRYNSFGEFNVPYGGMSYNKKEFAQKIDYIKSDELKGFLNDTVITNKDFEAFLRNLNLSTEDFIFVDPPYDSEFCEYDQNEFGRDDQIRLADLLAQLPAKIMVVIKETDFIYDIYNERGFNIVKFDKTYSVNFKNRNARAVKHLLITNY